MFFKDGGSFGFECQQTLWCHDQLLDREPMRLGISQLRILEKAEAS